MGRSFVARLKPGWPQARFSPMVASPRICGLKGTSYYGRVGLSMRFLWGVFPAALPSADLFCVNGQIFQLLDQFFNLTKAFELDPIWNMCEDRSVHPY